MIMRVLMCLVCVCSVVSAREEVSFNFGWRFIRGDPAGTPPSCSASSFTGNLTQLCTGLVFTPLRSEEDCRKACCPNSGYHPDCRIWQWCDPGDPAHWHENVTCGCYLGGEDAQCPSGDSKVVRSGGHHSKPWPSLAVPERASPGYDDSDWDLVDAPHDFVVDGDFSPNASDNGQHGYLPREEPGWYRKHFELPQEFQSADMRVWLRFNGVFHTSLAYLDGQPLSLGAGAKSGYTAFTAPLPTNLGGGKHVIAMRVDASFGSGHWYEGGGIYRDVYIIAADKVHVEDNGLFAPTMGDSVVPIAKLVNQDTTATHVKAKFTVWSPSGNIVGTQTSDAITIATNSSIVAASPPIIVSSPSRWSPQSPSLYRVSVEVLYASSDSVANTHTHTLARGSETVLDMVNVSIGFRNASFSASTGFSLNGARLVLRGFSNHNDMAGVGVAVPPRLNLFRAQMLRGVGGNIWRMSHNPGDPAMFDILDNLGIMSWDENRDYGKFQSVDMKDMVERDRNHAAIIVWSFCNEDECFESSPSIGDDYRKVTLAADPTRPISGNLLHDSSGTMVSHFDVVGVSHVSTLPSPWTPSPAGWYDPRYSYQWFHNHHPSIPLVSSESSSCNTQRGVNAVDIDNGSWDDVFNADCLSKTFCPPNTTKAKDLNIPGYNHTPGSCVQSWTMAYDDDGKIFPFMAGNLGIWTLFDYLGEPTSSNRKNACHGGHNSDCNANWPQVSCSFGSFDLAGFSKPAAYYYRSWWLANIPTTDASRTPVANAESVVKIVHDWALPAPPIVAVYSNLATTELFVNGKSLGKQMMMWANWTQWTPSFEAGNLTAVGYNNHGVAMATDTQITAGVASVVVLSVDVPSPRTGTGEALLLDGQDSAMLRATIVDANGVLVTQASHNITFSVVSGPGRIIGVGNGDPVSHERNKQNWRSAYHGLARVVVQTTINAVTKDRLRQSAIDLEGGIRTKIDVDGRYLNTNDTNDIIIQANVEGMASAHATIHVSTDASMHGVLAVAQRSVAIPIEIA